VSLIKNQYNKLKFLTLNRARPRLLADFAADGDETEEAVNKKPKPILGAMFATEFRPNI
jgi:hypothetical protein